VEIDNTMTCTVHIISLNTVLVCYRQVYRQLQYGTKQKIQNDW